MCLFQVESSVSEFDSGECVPDEAWRVIAIPEVDGELGNGLVEDRFFRAATEHADELSSHETF